MSVAFRGYAAAAAQVLDQIFGEPFIILPMAYVGGKYVADTSRAQASVTAIYTEKAVFSQPIGQRNAAATSQTIVAEHATAYDSIEILKAAVPYDVRAKDRFKRLSDNTFFEVQGVLNDDLDHVSFRVTKMGPQV